MHIEIDLPVPRWVRNAALVLVPVAVIVGTTAIVMAKVPNTFADGDMLSAQKVNDNFNALDARLAAGNAIVSATVRPVAGANCGIDRQDGNWIAGAVHSAAATCQIVITQNVFTGTPTCVASNQYFVSTISNLSSTGFSVEVDGTNGGLAGDGIPINIICVGPTM
jgi:hypothetical protein